MFCRKKDFIPLRSFARANRCNGSYELNLSLLTAKAIACGPSRKSGAVTMKTIGPLDLGGKGDPLGVEKREGE
jgi:hypothetical protein